MMTVDEGTDSGADNGTGSSTVENDNQTNEQTGDTSAPLAPVLKRHTETIIDVNQWSRKEIFDMYTASPPNPSIVGGRTSYNPAWGITVRLDVTKLRQACQKHNHRQRESNNNNSQSWSYSHASVFLYNLTCNQYEPMRYRIRYVQSDACDKKNPGTSATTPSTTVRPIVICHERVHPSMTIMRRSKNNNDETLSGSSQQHNYNNDMFGYVAWDGSTDSFSEFCDYAHRATTYFHNYTTGLGVDDNKSSSKTLRDDLSFGSILRFVDFTDYQHAETPVMTPSIPKYVFGKLCHDIVTDTWSQPFSLHVHHALLDGLHVGMFLEKFQHNLDNAETLLNT